MINHFLKNTAFFALFLAASVHAGPETEETLKKSGEISKKKSISGLSRNLLSTITDFLSFKDRLNLSQINKSLHDKIEKIPVVNMPERVKDEMQAGQLLLIDSSIPREEEKFFALNFLDEAQLLEVSKEDSQHKLTKTAKTYPLVLLAGDSMEPSYGYHPLFQSLQYPIVTYDLSLLEDPILLPNVVRAYMQFSFEDGFLTCRINGEVSRNVQELGWILPLIQNYRIQISSVIVGPLAAVPNPFLTALFATGYVSEAHLYHQYFMDAENLQSIRVLGLHLRSSEALSTYLPLVPQKTPNLEHFTLKATLPGELNLENIQPLDLPNLKSLSLYFYRADETVIADNLIADICRVFPKTIQSLTCCTEGISQAAFARIGDHFNSIHDLEMYPDLLSSKVSLKKWLESFSKHTQLSLLCLHFNAKQIDAIINMQTKDNTTTDAVLFNHLDDFHFIFRDFCPAIHNPKFAEALVDMLALAGLKAGEQKEESKSLKKIMIEFAGAEDHDTSSLCLSLLKGTTASLVLDKKHVDALQKHSLTDSAKKRIRVIPIQRGD